MLRNYEMRKHLSLLAACAMLAAPVYAQVGPVTLAYDVVSVKPNKTGGGMIRINQGSDMYAGTNVTLKMLLRYAYDLTTEDQITGLSGPLASGHFDIEAKMDADTVASLKKLSKDDSAVARRKMMQDMLVERFQLKVHHEQKELGMYDLVVAKGGAKLTPAPEVDGAPKGSDGKPQPKGSMMVRNGQLTGEGIPVSNLAMFLAQMLHKQVVDKTGMTGNYDMSLKWQPEEQAAESHDATGGEQAPSIFTAVQEQLGLKLEPTRGLVDTIVVDHVEVPSEN